jgi:MFS family permease
MTDQPVRGSVPLWRTPEALILIIAQLLLSIRDMPIGAFMLVYLQGLGYSTTLIAQISSSAQIAGMLTAMLTGGIAQRIGNKWMWVAGIGLAALNSLVFQSTSVWWIAGWWVIGGIGMALAGIGSASILTFIGGKTQIGVLSSLYILCFTIGGVIGNPLLGWVIAQYDYHILSGVALIMSAIGMSIVLFGIPHTAPATPHTTTTNHFDWQFIRHPQVPLIMGMRGLATVNYGMLTVLIPLLLNQTAKDIYLVASYAASMLVVASLIQFLAGRAADKWGALWPTIISFGVMVGCGCILCLGTHSVPLLFIFGIISNAAAWALSSLMYLWVADFVANDRHPLLLGWLHATWSICMVIGSLLGGWLIVAYQGLPFLVTGLLCLVPLWFTWKLYRSPWRSTTTAELT